MLIYLLLKQHNITKKYYLCKRTTNNIKTVFSYTGSGKLWKLHLKKHGNNISTAILEIAKNNQELKQKAAFYNTVWNIGSNNQFLNLRPEEGDGGDTWLNYKNKESRKLKVSQSNKIFNSTPNGILIRERVGQITKQNQLGKTMKDRMGEAYIDSRKGKKFNEIYKVGYDHPQQKPFKITLLRTGESWVFNNEAEFKTILHLNPDPTLRILKKQKSYTIKQVKVNSKHNFIKGDMLIFEYNIIL
jgi:hypothetical protein